jgi:hypothetical protein
MKELLEETQRNSAYINSADARRAGDADPSKAIIADTMKLVGNR